MSALWRALALAWLGGVASPAFADDAGAADRTIERPAASSSIGVASGLADEMPGDADFETRPLRPSSSDHTR